MVAACVVEAPLAGGTVKFCPERVSFAGRAGAGISFRPSGTADVSANASPDDSPIRPGMGVDILVEILRMSLPWTTRFSFDFFRSLVNISIISVLLRAKNSTVSTERKVEDVTHATVDDAKETLVFLFELPLVEYLYSNDARLFYHTCRISLSD